MSQLSGKKNSFDRFLKIKCCERELLDYDFVHLIYILPPSALQAMDIGVGTFASD